ncbi:alpha/beta hydrolase [Arthrobacter agilis]|uniref:alpha/beta hydrolase family protein n=1 Tax=Arthrobacter agilis TaxID=37921 RepID=UPI000B34CD4A|nr:alpha/beta hydrolase [Arthrobacter agilis]OUM42473.1 alpha/beta hydrolase [Arthrobacter agilis]PPB45820.1 alpha/beta hydrolase [Arthrobacter agilis]TPV26604.1 alpha/beta hydrolase [Arthrobacter agilis]
MARPQKPAALPQRYAYGDHPSQFADLHLPPEGAAVDGVVVIVHGGYWRSTYGAELGTPLARDLVSRGYACWNLEYRRAGGGGGWPATFDDVAAGIDHLAVAAAEHGLDLTRTTALGHSAGGHLAVWAAGREGLPAGSPGAGVPAVPLTAVVSQAGVLDLAAARDLGLSDGAVENLLGAPEDAVRYRLADPMTAVPLGVPVYAVHGKKDVTVPLAQSEAYVRAATEAGATAELVVVPGDHFAVITPGTKAWVAVVAHLERTRAGRDGSRPTPEEAGRVPRGGRPS